MAVLIVRASMSVLIRVVMGTGCETPIRQVTVLVNMEAMKLAGNQSGEGAGDVSPREGSSLLEQHNALSCLVWL